MWQSGRHIATWQWSRGEEEKKEKKKKNRGSPVMASISRLERLNQGIVTSSSDMVLAFS